MNELFSPPTAVPDDFTLGVSKKKDKNSIMDRKAFRLGVQTAINAQTQQSLNQQQSQLQNATMQFLQIQAQAALGQQALANQHMQQSQGGGPQEMVHYHTALPNQMPQ